MHLVMRLAAVRMRVPVMMVFRLIGIPLGSVPSIYMTRNDEIDEGAGEPGGTKAESV